MKHSGVWEKKKENRKSSETSVAMKCPMVNTQK